MITRPTTDQLIADVCQELVDAVLPALDRRDAAGTRGHGRDRVAQRGGAGSPRDRLDERRDGRADRRMRGRSRLASPDAELTAALAAFDEAPRNSLHLADVVETYERAGEAFAAALATAQREGSADLVDAARDLLQTGSAPRRS